MAAQNNMGKNTASGGKSKWIFIIGILFILWLISIVAAGAISLYFGGDYSIESKMGQGNVAVISVKGEITGDKTGSLLLDEGTASTTVVKFIKAADKDQGVKAILLEINSPGGAAVASEEIMAAFSKSQKLKVAVIRDVGASGAYWIASPADRIFASRMSLTGSIGVISSYLQFEGTMRKYGITYERLVAGEYKDIGSPFRNITDEEKTMFQEKIDKIHEYFLKSVADNRNMSKENIAIVSHGSFFLGEEALELGLIDEIGNKDDAVKYIEQEINASAKLVQYEERRGLFNSIIDTMSHQSFYVGQGIGSVISRPGIEESINIRT
ncbi:signal peptide peptidase SppA [Candidatus Woesearchaeota archaeon]|nr:signal peptide peptidase SppA [Candidatus Woesearchaeota archaeon]